jgi:hypothetical protein
MVFSERSLPCTGMGRASVLEPDRWTRAGATRAERDGRILPGRSAGCDQGLSPPLIAVATVGYGETANSLQLPTMANLAMKVEP